MKNFQVYFTGKKEMPVDINENRYTTSGYPNITKSRPYLFPIFQENYDYFLSYFGYFLLKRGRGHTLKIGNQNLT